MGLPFEVEFGKECSMTGFDINTKRIAELQSGHDHTLEVESHKLTASKHLSFTAILV